MIDALPAQEGPIIKQTFRGRTPGRANHTGDFHDLSAEEICRQYARRGDGHQAKGRLPVRAGSPRVHFESRQRVPRLLVAVFIDALDRRFAEPAAQRDVRDIRAGQCPKVNGRKNRGARRHVRPARQHHQQVERINPRGGPRQGNGGGGEGEREEPKQTQWKQISQQDTGDVKHRHQGKRPFHGGSSGSVRARRPHPEQQDAGRGPECVHQNIPDRRAA